MTFDPFVKFRHPEVAERQIDTLIGLCKGVVADGVVNQDEAEFLRDWLAANESHREQQPGHLCPAETGQRHAARRSPRRGGVRGSYWPRCARSRARGRARASSCRPRICHSTAPLLPSCSRHTPSYAPERSPSARENECKQEITGRGGAYAKSRAPGSRLPGPGELRHAKLDP